MTRIRRREWGLAPDGSPVELVELIRIGGMRAEISTYGATLVSLTAPDRDGAMADVVLGYDDLVGYVTDPFYFGCTVGRVANRIRDGRFELNGEQVELTRNWNGHHLHGGELGFSRRNWECEFLDSPAGPAVRLHLVSADGEEGYPGMVEATVDYTLLTDGLRIDYRAVTDSPTVVDMTNHTYFNLGGTIKGPITDHVLSLDCSRYLETDDDLVPTGKLLDCAGTPLDFSRPMSVGLHIDAPDPALAATGGYDHYFIIDEPRDYTAPVAQLCHGVSGRLLSVMTTQPGLQVYSGNHLAERVDGKLGAMYGRRYGLCLETHGYANAAAEQEFPSVVLTPDRAYEHRTEFRFSIM